MSRAKPFTPQNMYQYINSKPVHKDTIVKIRGEVNSILELNQNEKIILSQILFFEGLNKTEHSAGNKYFANLIGKSDRTVTRCIKKLEELGYIAVSIIDRCARIIKLVPEKIKSILSRGIDKMSKVIDNLSSTINSTIKTVKNKTRTFFKTKDNKDIYKKGNQKIEKNKIRMDQEDNETIEEYNSKCDQRESIGDVIIDRRYVNKNNNINTSGISDIIQYYKSKLLTNQQNRICQQ